MMSATNHLEPAPAANGILAVEFLEVEMSDTSTPSGCASCDDARERLATAVSLVKPVLAAVGILPEVLTSLVRTERDARVRRVTASPTIRIGREEVRPVHRDSTDEGRVWSWRGEDHAQPPVGMLVDLLLRGYAAQGPSQSLAADDIAPYVRQFLTRDEPQTPAAQTTACGCH